MKSLRGFIAISIICAALSGLHLSAQPKKAYKVFGVGFYNLENLFDTIPNNPLGRDLEYTPTGKNQWDGKKYRSKISNLARCIAAMTTRTTPGGPAILGVSEIENVTVLNDLVADPQIKPWNLQVVHHDSPDRRGVDVGLLYNPRMFQVVNVTNHTLTIPNNPDFRTRDQMCVVGLLDREPLAVIVNHWPSRLGGQKQSEYLREAAASLSKHIADSLWRIDPSMAVIIMGDLNDDPSDKSVAKVLGATKKPEKTAERGFYNPWWSILDDQGIGTLAYKGAWNLFDQILISGNLLDHNPHTGLTFMKAIVNNFDFLISKEGNRQGYPLRTFASGVYLNGYSDHFPTMVLLKKEVQPKH